MGMAEKREGRGGMYSRHSLLVHSRQGICIFISRHKRIYWLRFLIRISTLRYTRNKKKSYNSSIIIIYPSYNRKRGISCERNVLKQYDKKSLENYESLQNKVSRCQTSIKRRQRSKRKSIVIQIKCLSGIQIKRNSPIFILHHSQF